MGNIYSIMSERRCGPWAQSGISQMPLHNPINTSLKSRVYADFLGMSDCRTVLSKYRHSISYLILKWRSWLIWIIYILVFFFFSPILFFFLKKKIPPLQTFKSTPKLGKIECSEHNWIIIKKYLKNSLVYSWGILNIIFWLILIYI